MLPVWLLLAPRDYLSTFMKLGTIFALVLGVFVVLPEMKMPAITPFIDGSGPVVPGSLFPFCFITIACGAISGFHTLISSGITPKIITRESYTRPVGYGAMCLESLVAIVALVAAATLDPGVYLSMNIKAPGADAAAIAQATVTQVNAYGPAFQVTTDQMKSLADLVHENSLFGRTGGAATLAVGMANIFGKVFGSSLLGVWYHFALMFEALFILTTLDAGTRVGRYLLQDALGHVWKPLGNTSSLFSNLFASTLVVAAWGYFLLKAVYDPDGGIKALWPIFGIANQLLASIALCLATTVLLKTGLQRSPKKQPALALVTLLPLAWLLTVTATAAIEKIGHSNPKIGFLAGAAATEQKLPALEKALETAPDAAAKSKAAAALKSANAQIFNLRLDAGITAAFLGMVAAILGISLREWSRLLSGNRSPVSSETEPVWLAPGSVRESAPFPSMGVIAIGLSLLREISGEGAIDRAETAACACQTAESQEPTKSIRRNVFLTTTDARYRGINRCC